LIAEALVYTQLTGIAQGGTVKHSHRRQQTHGSLTMVTKKSKRGLLNVADAMEFLSVSRSKLYMLMRSGELPFVKLGKSRRVPMAALVKLIARNTHCGQD
jgi:excisionase family DNA binding protein